MEPDRGPEPEAEASVIVDRPDEERVRALAAEHGVEVERVQDEAFIEPVTATLVLFGASAAVATVSALVEQFKGGQVFDLRENAPRQAYRSKDVVYGLVEIIAADGTVTVEVREPRGMFGEVLDALRQTLLGLVNPSSASVKEKAAEAVGGAASVR